MYFLVMFHNPPYSPPETPSPFSFFQPKTVHMFSNSSCLPELLIAEFLLHVCVLHMLTNSFSLTNLSFVNSQHPNKRTQRVEEKCLPPHRPLKHMKTMNSAYKEKCKLYSFKIPFLICLLGKHPKDRQFCQGGCWSANCYTPVTGKFATYEQLPLAPATTSFPGFYSKTVQ